MLFVGNLLAPLKSLLQYPNFVENKIYLQEEARVCVAETLKICSSLAETVKSEGKTPKTLVYESLKEVCPAVLGLFALYIDVPCMSLFDRLLLFFVPS